MTFDAGLIFFISLLLMWIKPGPAQLLKIATALDKGLLAAIFISFGSIATCSLFFIFAALGYQALSDVFDYTGFFLQVFGAVYLIYLSIKGFSKIYRESSLSKRTDLPQEIKSKANLSSCFLIGVGITLSNPFWIFYFVGVLPSLISLGDISTDSYLIGAGLVFLSGIIVDWPMLTLITQLQNAFEGDKVTKYINLFVNFSFLLIAGFLLYSAFFVQELKFDINDVL